MFCVHSCVFVEGWLVGFLCTQSILCLSIYEDLKYSGLPVYTSYMLLPCRLHAHCTDCIAYIVMGTDNGVPIHYNTLAHLLHIAIYLDMHSFFLLNMLITFIFQNLHDDMWPWWKIWWILAISVNVHVLRMIFFFISR